MKNTINVTIALTTVPMRDRTGQRGRPQKHPQVALDFDGASKALEAFGEKKIRCEAFRLLREALGVGETVPCTEHPKDPSIHILKAMCGRNDFVVTVSDGPMESDTAPTVDAESAATVELPAAE